MSEYQDIAAITRLTGLSSRTLRFYETRGLIAPLRAASGRRLYGTHDLQRIHQIVTLKRAGFSLAAIGGLLGGREHRFAGLIDAQIAAVAEQMLRLGERHDLLFRVKARLAAQEVLDPATLCQLIRDSHEALTDPAQAWRKLAARYMDDAAREDFERAMPASGAAMDDAACAEQWENLGARITAALPLALDAPQALGFVREWMALLAPFSAVATPAMWDASRALYDDVDQWRGTDGLDPGFGGAVWQFINAATEAALARGEDVGPVPAWLRADLATIQLRDKETASS